MKRREFLRYVGASGYVATSRATTISTGQIVRSDSNRPNFLIIMADQHSPHVLGCYGDRVVRTPNLDALSSQGVLFKNTYCAAPLCVPSRTAFLTGQQPSSTCVWMNDNELSSEIPTFAHSLGAAGYDATLIGRMHFKGVDQWHGFGTRLVGDLEPIYAYNEFPLSPEWRKLPLWGMGPGRTSYQLYDDAVTKGAIKFLRDRPKDNKQPFCAVVGFVLPHSPYVCARADWEYYRDRVSLPEVPPDYFNRLNPAMQLRARPQRNLTSEQIRTARAGYYGLVTQVDRQVGQILNELERHEFAQNTVIVYTSDHGDSLGENGLWSKMNMYEGSVTVPLIISCPRRWAPATRHEVISLLDIAPTLLDLSHADRLPQATGNSLVPLLENHQVEWANEIFSEYPSFYGVPTMRMIRRGKWKLTYFDGYWPELFDLEADPHEFNDLAENVSFSEIRETLLGRVLSGWSAEVVKRETEKHLSRIELVHKWELQVRPPTTAQWVPPPHANQLDER